MNLALFDLDHTLIPFDSGMAWTQFLIAKGVLPSRAADTYLGYCHAYVAGTLDIHDMHRANVTPLARYPLSQIRQWGDEFEARLSPRLPTAMLDLVRSHQEAGHLCALVTATTRFIAEPLGRLFGLPHVVATEPVIVGLGDEGRLTGEIRGAPCFQQHKVTRVEQWLAGGAEEGGGPMSLRSFDRSWFYSDSASDLPLLRAVTDPVAVSPDARLRVVATEVGWPILESAT
ncbi:MAG: HAD family hydrolase [Rhizobacter sp.]